MTNMSRFSIQSTTSWYMGINSFDLTTEAKKWLSVGFDNDVDSIEIIRGSGGIEGCEKVFWNSFVSWGNLRTRLISLVQRC